jgi:penicillin-binding protein 1A
MGKSDKNKGKRGQRSSQKKAPAAPPAKEAPGSSLLWKLTYTCIIVVIWGVIGVAGMLAYFARDLPSTEGLFTAGSSQSITIVDVHGKVIARRGRLSGDFVSTADLPAHVSNAVIASEDRRFHSHFGIDPWGLGRAFWVNMQEGRVVQGGSTITQQLAKNLFLKPERTMVRKFQEAVLALYLESSLSKEEILSLYLNKVYFGAGADGIDEAARRYFNKSATKLGLVEAAMLAGLLKAPSRYSPVNGNDLAWERARVVLHTMVETGFISPEIRDDALHTRPKLAPGLFGKGSQYFSDWVDAQLDDLVGHTAPEIIVETTLDLNIQRQAEDAALRALSEPGYENLQVALIAMSPDGAVRAMVGGREHGHTFFNRATAAKRQPGSAFKPFVYLAALEAGLSPQSIVIDEPVTYRGWTPANFKSGYAGEITLTDALSNSVNTVAVQLCLQETPETVVDVAQRLGITSSLDAVPSIALGTSEVSLAELVSAYAPFASGGIGAITYGVKRIRTPDGTLLYERSGSGMGRVVDVVHVGQMNHMLMQAIRSGTGKQANLGSRPAAGKTGTTQDFKDAWFVGYTRQLVAGVWIGADTGQTMGKGVTGGTLPAQIWKKFMLSATAGQPISPLPGLDRMDEQPAPDAFEDILARILKDSDDTSGQN